MRSGFLGTLGLMLVVLKLMGLLALPWVWVLLPFWLPLALVLLGFIFAPLMALGALLLSPFWLLPIFLLILFGLTLIPLAAIIFMPIWLPIVLAVAIVATLGAGLWSKTQRTKQPRYYRPFTQYNQGNNDAVDVDSQKL